jgi:hypothetical protein
VPPRCDGTNVLSRLSLNVPCCSFWTCTPAAARARTWAVSLELRGEESSRCVGVRAPQTVTVQQRWEVLPPACADMRVMYWWCTTLAYHAVQCVSSALREVEGSTRGAVRAPALRMTIASAAAADPASAAACKHTYLRIRVGAAAALEVRRVSDCRLM